MRKQVQLVSYQYPGRVRVLINSYVYTYESSEVKCRRFIDSLNYGLGFHALAWFKGQAKLVGKEKTYDKEKGNLS